MDSSCMAKAKFRFLFESIISNIQASFYKSSHRPKIDSIPKTEIIYKKTEYKMC